MCRAYAQVHYTELTVQQTFHSTTQTATSIYMRTELKMYKEFWNPCSSESYGPTKWKSRSVCVHINKWLEHYVIKYRAFFCQNENLNSYAIFFQITSTLFSNNEFWKKKKNQRIISLKNQILWIKGSFFRPKLFFNSWNRIHLFENIHVAFIL